MGQDGVAVPYHPIRPQVRKELLVSLQKNGEKNGTNVKIFSWLNGNIFFSKNETSMGVRAGVRVYYYSAFGRSQSAKLEC